MDTIAFLDLEETLIDNWNSFMPVNVPQVCRWRKALPFGTRFGLFSWAVYHEEDLARFRRHEELLEHAFDIVIEPEFKLALTDIRPLLRDAIRWNEVTLDDVFDFFNKERAFVEFSKQKQFDGKHLILLDDTVQNITFMNHDTGTRIDFVDVKKLQ